ncbi:uncharacterized protein LOC121737367 isoform X2 [Aricia agestis]|uniref:uncharacterized protein LOC121737367 isoform X2 n=1 Tax=Aricia agestis TaxID=91739 RepID=UPI001C2047CC|nr:uncharacterized protein LOC121737367 isoform X2 [Aricia agestis]
MSVAIGSTEFTKSNVLLTAGCERRTFRERTKDFLKNLRYCLAETTVEPCLFIYMLCTSLSSLAVQNMHLEKSCRANFQFSDDICDRIKFRNTTGLDAEVNAVQSLVAKVVAWKFPLQTSIPAAMVIFIGAYSDRTKRRKIFILIPFLGEIVANAGLLLATYYMFEVSLTATALIEALPAAFSGSYIIIFMGMYSFMADRTTEENRTFRLGLVTICVSLGTPTGTALSGIILKCFGYYGVFTLCILLHVSSLLYGVFKLEDVTPPVNVGNDSGKLREVFSLVTETVLVVVRPRAYGLRSQIWAVIVLYVIMVGPLYGTAFCIGILSKKCNVQDSMIGALAGVSRIAGCLVFAFSPTRQWFYSAPLFNIFSHTGLTAVRSIATKSVPVEEVAKLSSVIGVMEAIAPSVYMPTSSLIYVSSIETFPGAFYLFDATLTLVALALFTNIYFIMKKRSKMDGAEPKNKEEFARCNEVSRF